MPALGKRRGFTLLELIVFISIVGILAALIIPRFTQYRYRGFMAAVRFDARHAYTVVNIWKSDHPGETAPEETIRAEEPGAVYDALRASPGVTITIASGGQISVTHSDLGGSYIINPATGAAADTLASK